MNPHEVPDEQLGFLQIAEAAQRIAQHIDLFLWLQGDLQRHLPHEVLIAAWGDFASGAVSFDVVSPLPQLRTERLYLWNPAGSAAETLPACCGLRPDGVRCGVIPFLVDLHARWRAAGRAPYASHFRPEDGGRGFICPECDNESFALMATMQSCLVHGFADRRGRSDCLYVLLSAQELLAPRFRRALRFLLPYIDFSLRQVAHLPVQHAIAAVTADVEAATLPTLLPADESAAAGLDLGLTAREAQIMEWVRGGKTNYEIGKILDISAFTVKNHLQRIFKKMDVSNRAQAVERLQGTTRKG